MHRCFAEVAILENGTIQHAGRFKLEHRRVIAFGKTLKRSDEVVMPSAGVAASFAALIALRITSESISNWDDLIGSPRLLSTHRQRFA